ARDMIENGNAVSDLRWMMEGQQEATRPKPDVLRLHQRLSHQKIGRRMWLPRRGVMLANPALLVAEFVEPTDHLEVPFVTVLKWPLGRMRWHREIAELHECPPCGPFQPNAQRMIPLAKRTGSEDERDWRNAFSR